MPRVRTPLEFRSDAVNAMVATFDPGLRVGGFRGNFPESFGTSWPTSELHERQIFNTMPPHWACKEIATQQRIEALSRLLTAAQDAVLCTAQNASQGTAPGSAARQ
jgi:hypothetical protein